MLCKIGRLDIDILSVKDIACFLYSMLLGQVYQLIKGSSAEQGVDRDSINQQVSPLFLVELFLLGLAGQGFSPISLL